MTARVVSTCALACALGLAVGAAYAQPTDADAARARALFEEGRAALAHDDPVTACAKLSESLAIVSATGTILNLAQCEERQGHLVAALGYWIDGISRLRADDERLPLSKRRVDDLEKRIPRIVLRPPEKGAPSVRVRLDGKAVEAGSGAPLRVDSGPHEIVIESPDRPAQTVRVSLSEGEEKEIILAVAPGERVVERVVDRRGGGRSEGSSARRVAGFVIAGIGVATLAVGAVAGVLTIAKKNEVESDCGGDVQNCTRLREAEGDAAQGRTFSTLSTVLVPAGMVAIAAGAILVATGGRRAAPTSAIRLRPAPSAARIEFVRTF